MDHQAAVGDELRYLRAPGDSHREPVKDIASVASWDQVGQVEVRGKQAKSSSDKHQQDTASDMLELACFISAPIKLAAKIDNCRRASRAGPSERPAAGRRKVKSPEWRKAEAREKLISWPIRLRGRHTPPGAALVLVVAVAAAGRLAAAALHEQQVRHHAHYLEVPASSHFKYAEGRQSDSSRQLSERSMEGGGGLGVSAGPATMHKRSSALLTSGPAHYPPLVGSGRAPGALSRRMMFEGRPQVVAQLDAGGIAEEADETSGQVRSGAEEAELLRQKQHIQYHDAWPSTAGKCHKRTLNFCASVLPFNTTTFPNIIGDTNRFQVKRSLPFFGFLAKSSCNRRLDELLCLLLEPPCAHLSGLAIPPCKKFCRLALEGCNEYIPATLALSSVFDCRQYPDSNDPSVCINLAQGSKCSQDEFKCPDKTCIPRNWLCDGVRDCIFAADEANCTAIGYDVPPSVCSTEEFKCDGKCVPKAWKCDGERDCLDGSDEESCNLRPRCGPDRFKCADGNGCIPKRWVCDGKAECRDGSDEMNCELRECSENDFKCDNGICIPKLWRCDRQADCKDASDERHCVYPTATPTNSSSSATVAPPAARYQKESPINLQYPVGGETQPSTGSPGQDHPATSEPASQTSQQQLDASLGGDVSRIISQPESTSSPAATTLAEPESQASTTLADIKVASQVLAKEMKKFDYDMIQSASNSIQTNELAPSQTNHIAEPIGSASQWAKQQQVLTQIDFVPQQQQQQQPARQVSLERGRKFGQVMHKSSSPTATATPTTTGYSLTETSPVALADLAPRLPIYRSLFKTLKGQGRPTSGQGSHSNQHRHVVAIARRRRDRHATPSLRGAPAETVTAESGASGPASQPLPVRGPSQAQVQTRSPGVASYLQMLNSRYNLRLPRVAPASAPLVA